MPENKKIYKCSFCGFNKKQVKILIAGIEGHICENCIERASEILDDELYNGRNALERSKVMHEARELREEIEELKLELASKEIELASVPNVKSLLAEIDSLRRQQKDLVATTISTSVGVINVTEIESLIDYLNNENIFRSVNEKITFNEVIKYLNRSKKRERRYFAEVCFEKISNGETKDVIRLLIQFAKDHGKGELKKEVLQLSSKWNNLSKEIRKGTLRQEDSNLEQNKINAAIIEIVEQVEFM